jgi:hypothetical protein
MLLQGMVFTQACNKIAWVFLQKISNIISTQIVGKPHTKNMADRQPSVGTTTAVPPII